MKMTFRLTLALLVLQFLSLPSMKAAEASSDEEVITVEEEAEATPGPSKPVDEVEDVVELEVDVDETPAATAVATPEATPEVTPEATAEPTPEPTAAVSERMRDVYEKGIDLYQRKKYAQALEELDRACAFKRGSAQAWLFAEAHAMRGVICQYYLKTSGHKEKAREAYSTALEWDPQNKTAKRHIRQVR